MLKPSKLIKPCFLANSRNHVYIYKKYLVLSVSGCRGGDPTRRDATICELSALILKVFLLNIITISIF